MAPIGGYPILGLLFSIFYPTVASVSSYGSVQPPGFLAEAATCGDGGRWMGLGAVQPSIPGTQAFTRHVSEHRLQLSRRDCLSNGTNYCFGNSVNYCAGCGVCCADSANKWCCAADGICCGKSCCGKRQSCQDGQCIGNPSVTTTVLSTIHSTITRLVTKIDTVIIAVISTSFVDTVVTLTESKSGATYTDITFVTVTVAGERSEPSHVSDKLQDAAQKDYAGDKNSAANESDDDGIAKAQPVDVPAVTRRQESSRAPASVFFSTVTTSSVIIQLDEIISTVSSTTTISSVSVVIQEVHRTRTSEIDAITTITTTETQTFTSRPTVTATLIVPGSDPGSNAPPLTVTSTAPPRTQTSFASPDPSSSPDQGASAGNRGPPLSTAAIAGIAAGSAGFAALVAIAIYVFFLLRARRARKLQEWEDTLSGLSIPRVVYGGDIRQPRLPNISQSATQARFAPAVFAASHHARDSPRRQSAFASTYSTERSVNSIGGTAHSVTLHGKPSHRSSEATSVHTVIPNVVELGDTSRIEISGGEGWPTRDDGDHGRIEPMSSSPPGVMLATSPMSPDILESPLALPLRTRRYSNYRDY